MVSILIILLGGFSVWTVWRMSRGKASDLMVWTGFAAAITAFVLLLASSVHGQRVEDLTPWDPQLQQMNRGFRERQEEMELRQYQRGQLELQLRQNEILHDIKNGLEEQRNRYRWDRED